MGDTKVRPGKDTEHDQNTAKEGSIAADHRVTTDSGDRQGTTGRNNAGGLSTDDVFHVLQNARRREVLAYLADTGDATIRELSESIAAKENGIDDAQLRSKQRKRVYISLYQIHLPTMHDLGVIDFDKPRGTVALRDDSQLRPHLHLIEDSSPYRRATRGMSVTGYLILLVVVLLILGGLFVLTVA